MSTPQAKREKLDVVVRLTMDEARAEVLDALADYLANGEPANRSAAMRYLIDRHAGRALEALKLEAEEEKRPSVEVVRFGAKRLSRELVGVIAGAIMAGLPRVSAYRLAGVTERQQRGWEAHGKKDRNDGKESLYADLVTAILQAEAEQQAENIAQIRKHRAKTWTAAAWLLERMYPDEYGERKRIDSKVQHSLIPMIDFDRLTLGEARALVELLRKASPDADGAGVGRFARPAAELVPEDIAQAIDAEWDPVEAPALEAGPEAPVVSEQKPGS